MFLQMRNAPRAGAVRVREAHLRVAAVLEAVQSNQAPVAKGTDDIERAIVMPCLNEAKTVGVRVHKAMSALETMGVHGEVIVADNGSSDGSVDIARGHGGRVVHVERKGY